MLETTLNASIPLISPDTELTSGSETREVAITPNRNNSNANERNLASTSIANTEIRGIGETTKIKTRNTQSTGKYVLNFRNKERCEIDEEIKKLVLNTSHNQRKLDVRMEFPNTDLETLEYIKSLIESNQFKSQIKLEISFGRNTDEILNHLIKTPNQPFQVEGSTLLEISQNLGKIERAKKILEIINPKLLRPIKLDITNLKDNLKIGILKEPKSKAIVSALTDNKINPSSIIDNSKLGEFARSLIAETNFEVLGDKVRSMDTNKVFPLSKLSIASRIATRLSSGIAKYKLFFKNTSYPLQDTIMTETRNFALAYCEPKLEEPNWIKKLKAKANKFIFGERIEEKIEIPIVSKNKEELQLELSYWNRQISEMSIKFKRLALAEGNRITKRSVPRIVLSHKILPTEKFASLLKSTNTVGMFKGFFRKFKGCTSINLQLSGDYTVRIKKIDRLYKQVKTGVKEINLVLPSSISKSEVIALKRAKKQLMDSGVKLNLKTRKNKTSCLDVSDNYARDTFVRSSRAVVLSDNPELNIKNLNRLKAQLIETIDKESSSKGLLRVFATPEIKANLNLDERKLLNEIHQLHKNRISATNKGKEEYYTANTFKALTLSKEKISRMTGMAV